VCVWHMHKYKLICTPCYPHWIILFRRNFFGKSRLLARRLQFPSLVADTASPLVVATLGSADANDLQHLAPEADGRTVESLLVSVDTWFFPD
jgi:hypothetical protein